MRRDSHCRHRSRCHTKEKEYRSTSSLGSHDYIPLGHGQPTRLPFQTTKFLRFAKSCCTPSPGWAVTVHMLPGDPREMSHPSHTLLPLKMSTLGPTTIPIPGVPTVLSASAFERSGLVRPVVSTTNDFKENFWTSVPDPQCPPLCYPEVAQAVTRRCLDSRPAVFSICLRRDFGKDVNPVEPPEVPILQ